MLTDDQDDNSSLLVGLLLLVEIKLYPFLYRFLFFYFAFLPLCIFHIVKRLCRRPVRGAMATWSTWGVIGDGAISAVRTVTVVSRTVAVRTSLMAPTTVVHAGRASFRISEQESAREECVFFPLQFEDGFSCPQQALWWLSTQCQFGSLDLSADQHSR